MRFKTFLVELLALANCGSPFAELTNQREKREKRSIQSYTANHDWPAQQVEGVSFFPNSSRVAETFQPQTKSAVIPPGVLAESFHNPAQPRFEHLLRQMRPIIPGRFTPRQAPHRVESPFAPFLRNIIQLSKDLKIKLNPPPGGKKDKLLLLIAKTAKELLAKNNVKQDELTGLMALFNEFFAEPRMKYRGGRLEPEVPKAPFCKLGEDCFVDVDHPKLAMEIKRLALTLASYLKSRMKESLKNPGPDPGTGIDQLSVKYKTDAVLTQVVANIAKLHRAVLRNWHHILMMIGNFAGPNMDADIEEKIPDERSSEAPMETTVESSTEGSEPEDESKTRKKREISPDMEVYKKQVRGWINEMESIISNNEMAKTYYDNYHEYPDVLCGSILKGASLEKKKKCSNSDFWFLDNNCKSVVTDPQYECYPADSWVLERNQYAYKITKGGNWFFTVSISTSGQGDKDHIVTGQLMRIPKGTTTMQVLLRIDNFLPKSEEGENQRKIQMSVGGSFHEDDLVVLRLVPSTVELSITFYGIHEHEGAFSSKDSGEKNPLSQ